MKAIIVGAGIGGLATALFLNKHGIGCEVFEKAPAIEELGVGINLMPQATASFDEIGMLPALERVWHCTRPPLLSHGSRTCRMGRAARTARGVTVSANLDPSRPAAAPALQRLPSTCPRWCSCRSHLHVLARNRCQRPTSLNCFTVEPWLRDQSHGGLRRQLSPLP